MNVFVNFDYQVHAIVQVKFVFNAATRAATNGGRIVVHIEHGRLSEKFITKIFDQIVRVLFVQVFVHVVDDFFRYLRQIALKFFQKCLQILI